MASPTVLLERGEREHMGHVSTGFRISLRPGIVSLMMGLLVLVACAPADVGVTEAPTEPPTEAPTEPPTEAPTEPPTEEPIETPTEPPTESPTEPPATGEEVEVLMVDVAFEPEEVTVAAGTTVTWINEDAVQHTVTAGTRGDPTGMFDETVAGGGSFSFTFEEAGTYEYFCSFHPGMSGVIIVEE